jgi:Reverse transcriptase (RNA-dependent DNA polymerase)
LQLDSWNVRTLREAGALDALTLELRHYRVNITAIQETRLPGRDPFNRNGFTVLLSGGTRSRTGGTGFLVDAKWSTGIMDWKPVDGRICVLRVRGKFFNTSIINAYAPHNGSPDKDKDDFYSLLEKTYNECPRHDVRIVIGDLNAQVGREEIFKPVIGKFSLHRDSNENGLRLINFAAGNNMVISSTVFRRKNIHKATWISPGERVKTQIDHLLIDSRHASDVLNVRSFRCRARDIQHQSSDHFLLGAKIRARISNVYTKKGNKSHRLDMAKLQMPERRKEFQQKLENKLSGLEGQTSWAIVRDMMKEVAEDVLGLQQPRRNEWFDDDCRAAVQAVIEERARGRDSRSKHERIRALQREKKKVLRTKKRQFDQQKLAELDHLHTINETRKFYEAVRAAKNGFQPRTSMCRRKDGTLVCDTNGILDRWKEFFNEHLNASAYEIQEAPSRRPYESDDGKRISAPSRTEVEDAINRLKNNKAPGDDSLPGELFKSGGTQLKSAVYELIVKVWSSEKLPKEWKTGVICPIFKKGCKLECANYRGIMLLPSGYKIFSILLADILRPLMEDFLHPYQAGFRKGLSTTDQIFCIRQIIQKSSAMNTETDHLFIDFKAAYDTIDREQLWTIMAEFGFPHKLIRLLKATLTDVECCVKVGGNLSGSFKSEVGLRQGDALSTMLFNIALEGVIRRAGVEMSGTVFTKSTQLLAFADDIDIIGRNIRAVTEAYSKLEREANRIGLHVNEDKTKFLMVSASERTRKIVGTQLVIGDKSFEVVKEFKYLGAMVDDCFNTSYEIRQRIVSAQKAFYGIKHLLRSKEVTRKAKFELYKTLIRPVAIYGSESWNTTDEDEYRLGVFERRVLRTILGPKKISDGQYQVRFNHELYQVFREPDIVATVRLRRLAWAGHVVRREEDRPVQQTLRGEFRDGTRTRGRPKNSWMDAVDKDSAAFGLSNWQREAKDRSKYRNFLNSVKARTRADGQ